MAEKAGESAWILFRRGSQLFAVQGDVDGGLRLPLSPPPGRLRGSDMDGRGRLRLFLVLRAVPHHLQDGGRGHPEGSQQFSGQQKGKEHDGNIFGDRYDRCLRQQAGDCPACLQGDAAGPEALEDSLAAQGIRPAGEDGVEQSARSQGQQQSSGSPQRHRAPPMQQQDPSRQQHGRARQPVSIAEQSLQKLRQQVDEDGLHAAVAHQHTQGQHQQDRAPHLAADRALLGLLALCRAGAGSAAALFRCRFLLR